MILRPRTCRFKPCRRPFVPTVKWQEFCGLTCKRAWHEAERRRAMALLRKGRI